LDSRTTNEKIKDQIIEEIIKQKLKNIEELKRAMYQKYRINTKLTEYLLIELEDEKRLHFSKAFTAIRGAKNFVFSHKTLWYWGVIILSTATAVSIFTIPENDYPIAYVRIGMGIIFLLFLPGYSFIKALFPMDNSVKIGFEKVDNLDRIVLSIGTSIVLVPLVGLVLNYSPWGIRLTSITVSLLALTVILSTAAILRERKK
jgi:uncharacterized membrane protein